MKSWWPPANLLVVDFRKEVITRGCQYANYSSLCSNPPRMFLIVWWCHPDLRCSSVLLPVSGILRGRISLAIEIPDQGNDFLLLPVWNECFTVRWKNPSYGICPARSFLLILCWRASLVLSLIRSLSICANDAITLRRIFPSADSCLYCL